MPQKKIQIGGNRFGLFVYSQRDWWFRLFGYGLSTQPLQDHKPLFSERNGFRPTRHIFGQCWQILKPARLTNEH